MSFYQLPQTQACFARPFCGSVFGLLPTMSPSIETSSKSCELFAQRNTLATIYIVFGSKEEDSSTGKFGNESIETAEDDFWAILTKILLNVFSKEELTGKVLSSLHLVLSLFAFTTTHVPGEVLSLLHFLVLCTVRIRNSHVPLAWHNFLFAVTQMNPHCCHIAK